MRIAVWHNLPSGGAKRALYDHVRGLVDRGHSIESWCLPTSDPRCHASRLCCEAGRKRCKVGCWKLVTRRSDGSPGAPF